MSIYREPEYNKNALTIITTNQGTTEMKKQTDTEAFDLGFEQGLKLERARQRKIIRDWARERDLGVDALLAKIDGHPLIADEDFEIPDLSQELREWAEAIEDKGRFRKAIKKAISRL
jgi:hypothetical protein